MARRSKIVRKWRRRFIGWTTAVILLLVVQVGITFVPYADVPEEARPLYNELLALRNRLVRRTGLPISLYSDTARVASGSADIQVYFAPSPRIDDHLVAFIDGAREQIDLAIYDLDLPNVVKALVAAHDRQVRVRVIVDTDNLYLRELEPLKRVGIKVIGDERSAIMHNKFVVVDRTRVWTGSYNFTGNGTLRNDNNALTLVSREIAANYSEEFEEMWAGRFGSRSPAATPYSRVRHEDLEIRNLFAPEDEVMDAIIGLVSEAEVSVEVMAFSFTHQALARSMQRRAGKNVRVRCLLDAGQAGSEYSRHDYLAENRVEVKLSENRRGVMHHKVIIVDERYVITGSFNFSANADTTNDENLLIFDSPELAVIYAEEFRRCWDGTKGY